MKIFAAFISYQYKNEEDRQSIFIGTSVPGKALTGKEKKILDRKGSIVKEGVRHAPKSENMCVEYYMKVIEVQNHVIDGKIFINVEQLKSLESWPFVVENMKM